MAGLRDIDQHEGAPAAPLDAALSEALRAKMRAILDQDVTAQTLVELEKTARLARELLIVGRDPKALNRVGGLNTVMAGEYMSNSEDVMAPSSPAETFGATLIREFVPAITALIARKHEPTPLPPSLIETVSAIAYAKERGLNDVVFALTVQLDRQMKAQANLEASPPSAGQLTMSLPEGVHLEDGTEDAS